MIVFALDLQGNRIYIENAEKNSCYYCEECFDKLAAKNSGTYKAHHYAHISNSNSELRRQCDTDNKLREANQLSEWHKNWQEKYPENQREVIIQNKDKTEKCRADILLPNKKTIIEFQHSKLHHTVFNHRNEFYTSLGYEVIWLFDFNEISGKYKYLYPDNYDSFIEDFVKENQEVYAMDHDVFSYTFGDWRPKYNKNIHVYFSYTYKNWTFYKYVQCVTGGKYYNLPMHLFVVNLKERDFLRRIGINSLYY